MSTKCGGSSGRLDKSFYYNIVLKPQMTAYCRFVQRLQINFFTSFPKCHCLFWRLCWQYGSQRGKDRVELGPRLSPLLWHRSRPISHLTLNHTCTYTSATRLVALPYSWIWLSGLPTITSGWRLSLRINGLSSSLDDRRVFA